MNRTDLSRLIRSQWPAIVAASRCRPEALSALPVGPLRLLGSSTKTIKGERRGVLTRVLYMPPAEASGRNLCPMSTLACRGGCLGDNSGRMVMAPVRAAMLWKAALRFGAPALFDALLRLDIAETERKASRLGFIPAVRLDGTSDLGDAVRFAPLFPSVVFYDYTKRESAARRILRAGKRNHSATLSYSGENRAACLSHLRAGGTVAVPFAVGRGGALPAQWEGFPVVDGDADDYRPADPAGSVVGLRWKGPKRTMLAAAALGWAQ